MIFSQRTSGLIVTFQTARHQKDPMNPIDQLRSLTDLFPAEEPLFATAEHIPSALTPEPFKTLLVHRQHMTVAMEMHHRCSVDVRVLRQNQQGLIYTREILLLRHGTDRVVQYGIVRFDLGYVTEAVRDEVIAAQTPLGRILINHNVLRHIDLEAILEIALGPRLVSLFGRPRAGVTYGRMATIFCNRQPAIDLLEICSPEV